jgi:hypothetical protein
MALRAPKTRSIDPRGSRCTANLYETFIRWYAAYICASCPEFGLERRMASVA